MESATSTASRHASFVKLFRFYYKLLGILPNSIVYIHLDLFTTIEVFGKTELM